MGGRRQGAPGMTFIEITIALMLLSLITVMLLAGMSVMSRREVILVDRRAKANAIASRIISEQRALVRVGSLLGLQNALDVTEVKDNVTYTIDMVYQPGYIDSTNGSFVPTTSLPMLPIETGSTTMSPTANAAYQLSVTVAWPPNQSLVRTTIIVK